MREQVAFLRELEAVATGFFGKSEEETESRVFAALDAATLLTRVPQGELDGRVRHMITKESIRPDGLLVFPHDAMFRCLAGRVFAIEIKPDVVVRDHLKVISELTEQARSYVDSHYDHSLVSSGVVDGCIVYPDLQTILGTMQPNAAFAKVSRNDDYKQGVIDMQRRSLTRQRIFELVLAADGFEIRRCDDWLLRFSAAEGHYRPSGRNHRFQRKVGSDYK